MNCILQYVALHGITRSRLARMLDMSEQQLSKYFNGRTQPNLDTLRKMREVMGITADRLMDDWFSAAAAKNASATAIAERPGA